MGRNNKTVFILLDAFRPDYIKKAPFIEKLSKTSISGPFIPPFGFMSTCGAIFAGLDPEESELCHKFCLNQKSSPFNFVKYLPKYMLGGRLKPAGRMEKLLISLLVRLRERNTAVSHYGSPEMIPLGLLPLFDFGQKFRPDQDGFVPSLSLFDVLKQERKKYLYLGFARPRSFQEYTRKFMQNIILRKRYDDDEYLMEVFKKDVLKNDYDFIYLHLNFLDSLGHSFGPDSMETEKGIRRVDGWIEELYNLLKERYPCLNFVLCSDHGMTEVKGTVDIWNIILKSKLKPSRDFIPFLDATQARFWGDARALGYIRDMLADLKGGRFLAEDDFAKFAIRFKDNRYADLYWMCEDGMVLSPNFFDKFPTKGTHGYIPGCKTDYAFFLINPVRNVKHAKAHHTSSLRGTQDEIFNGVNGDGIKPGRKEECNLKDIFSSLLRLMDLPCTGTARPPSSSGRVLF